MTEAVCAPNRSRALVSELLFEQYNVPSVCYGIDSLFSLHYHQQTNAAAAANSTGGDDLTSVFDSNGSGVDTSANASALVIDSSHLFTHVLPVLRGRVHLGG
jgi:actin-related protein